MGELVHLKPRLRLVETKQTCPFLETAVGKTAVAIKAASEHILSAVKTGEDVAISRAADCLAEGLLHMLQAEGVHAADRELYHALKRRTDRNALSS